MYVFFSWDIKRVELFHFCLSEAPFFTLTRALTSRHSDLLVDTSERLYAYVSSFVL